MAEHEAWCVFDSDGDPSTVARTERGATARQELVDERCWQTLLSDGYSVRRVRIVEVTDA